MYNATVQLATHDEACVVRHVASQAVRGGAEVLLMACSTGGKHETAINVHFTTNSACYASHKACQWTICTCVTRQKKTCDANQR
jgi:hypothetical protein